MNMKLLRSQMLMHDDTQVKLAEALGLPQSAISMRMTGKIDFRQNEMEAIRKRYQLTPDQVVEIFFAN